MLMRLACTLAFAICLLVPSVAPNVARAGCADEISRLMSKDTERMLSQYQRVTRRIEREGSNPSLRAEECRIAKQLEPQLANQIAAIRQSSCRRDPNAANMVADIVRGHEDDLASVRRVTAQADCK